MKDPRRLVEGAEVLLGLALLTLGVALYAWRAAVILLGAMLLLGAIIPRSRS